ncbi:MAG: hypothetical protein M0Z85_03345 [Gammaproteobacteria bacterium]|jgi:hypothetical protein|nr:hypothetical protein [Gammaproteobacteria bacterium]
MAGPAISADAGAHNKTLHIKTFVEWRMADILEYWLAKKAARLGHASPMTNPIRNDKKKRGRKPRALLKTPIISNYGVTEPLGPTLA